MGCIHISYIEHHFPALRKSINVKVTVGLLKAAMVKSEKKQFLIDGFPRNVENLSTWVDILGNDTTLIFTLFFECPEKTLEERLLLRSQTLGRNDDSLVTIKNRFHSFHEDSLPVVELLEILGKVKRISSMPLVEVFAQVSQYLEPEVIERERSIERSLAMIKPDAVQAGKEKAIIAAIEENGFRITDQVQRTLSKEEAEAFYAEPKGKPFYERLITFMTSGPVIALALEKQGAITAWRRLMGPTNPETARIETPTSIRARFGCDNTRNATRRSGSMNSAARELKFWFPAGLRRRGGESGPVFSSSPHKRLVEKEKQGEKKNGDKQASKQQRIIQRQ